MRRLRPFLLAGISVLAYLATGIIVVQPNEKVIVRRFGAAVAAPLEPGLHLDLPWGLSKIERIRVDQMKQVSVGADRPSIDALDRMEEVEESFTGRFLTGDQNLVHLGISVQYVIGDPHRYAFVSADPERLIASLTESLVTAVVATLAVDDILLSARASLGVQLTERLRRVVEETYDLGVLVRGVSLTGVAPPAEVADAFYDVVKARSDRQKRIHDAESHAGRVLRQAHAQAREIHNRSEAYAERRRTEANSEAARFQERLAAFARSASKSSVVRRLILETLEEALPRTRKVIVDADSQGGETIDLSILRTTSP